ncbi:transcriptional regulator [Streptomyces monashensis]|uniref:Transcriptional regulator n=2 Tax=Streptomyces monashensis TaxID=1678012 RepID=A0A1S2PS06_9ACTN|nr:transcriptional regulator [Streptomyces monashensis]
MTEDSAPTGEASGRRTELAAFLRSRRERITPADVGMPPGIRRRTPGLRREEVAQLAGVGITWYTWLEQGRPINVSVQVLDSVARTLRLDATERGHLHRLAGVPEIAPADGDQILEPEIQQILDSIPVPAVVFNTRYDVLAWNRPYQLMWPRFIERGELNLLCEVFLVPPCCNTMENRESELPALVATFRAAYARHLKEPAWTDLVRRLSAASPEFAVLWAAQDVALPVTREFRVYANPAVGQVVYRCTTLAVTATPETYINVYTPADDVSRERVEWLLAHPDAIPAPSHTH